MHRTARRPLPDQPGRSRRGPGDPRWQAAAGHALPALRPSRQPGARPAAGDQAARARPADHHADRAALRGTGRVGVPRRRLGISGAAPQPGRAPALPAIPPRPATAACRAAGRRTPSASAARAAAARVRAPEPHGSDPPAPASGAHPHRGPLSRTDRRAGHGPPVRHVQYPLQPAVQAELRHRLPGLPDAKAHAGRRGDAAQQQHPDLQHRLPAGFQGPVLLRPGLPPPLRLQPDRLPQPRTAPPAGRAPEPVPGTYGRAGCRGGSTSTLDTTGASLAIAGSAGTLPTGSPGDSSPPRSRRRRICCTRRRFCQATS